MHPLPKDRPVSAIGVGAKRRLSCCANSAAILAHNEQRARLTCPLADPRTCCNSSPPQPLAQLPRRHPVTEQAKRAEVLEVTLPAALHNRKDVVRIPQALAHALLTGPMPEQLRAIDASRASQPV